MPTRPALLDDRNLVAILVGAYPPGNTSGERYTTSYFYFRACRAFVLGGASRLSGPYQHLDADRKAQVLEKMLSLPDDIGLPDPRRLVPVMAEVQRRHRHLNMLNTEATAAALLLGAELHLTRETATGQLDGVLDEERIRWRVVDIPGS